MSEMLIEHGTRLPDVDGIGPVVATRLPGRSGRANRFPDSSLFATYAGVAACGDFRSSATILATPPGPAVS